MKSALLCGVDEAGRGPLAGPVCAAAVILDCSRPIAGLADSKILAPDVRARLTLQIKRDALAWAVAWASVEEIDRLNILRASLLAMQRAVENLPVAPGRVLIDGNQCPSLGYPVRAIVKGDATVASISAASILAKTARDAWMQEMHAQFPVYGFDRHKGYATALHLRALREHGASPLHRRSFAPVRDLLERRSIDVTL